MKRSTSLRTARLTCLALVSLLLVSRLFGQTTTKPTDGSTPPGLQAGAPEGAYSLSGFDNVNLYNGSLNFALPLLKIGGRGSASHNIFLSIERHWMIEKLTDLQDNTTVYPVDGREEETKPGYGPGIMAIRYGTLGGSTPCEWHPPNLHYDSDKRYSSTVTRLSFTQPDGTESEFRDLSTGGTPAPAQPCGNHDPASIGYNRGRVFVSVDGSMMTFISDSDIRDEVVVGSLPPETPNISGYLLRPDGTRYRIDAGKVTWIRDRNGNRISFVYGGTDGYRVTSITDSLNRQVTISYDVNEGGQYGICDKISYKGFGGNARVIRISKTALANVLRAGYSITTYAYLFPGGGGGAANYNPTVVSAVWLPDSDGVTRRYQFQYNNYAELARVVLPTGGAYEYDHGAGTANGTSDGLMFGFPNQAIYRRIVERRVYSNGGTGDTYDVRMTYSVPDSQTAVCCSTTTAGYINVEQRDGENHLLSSSRHYFSGPGAGNSFVTHLPTQLNSPLEGKETQTDVYDTNGTTVLRRSINTWQEGVPIASHPSAPINPRIVEADTVIEPGGANLVSKQTFDYDQYNNQTDAYEYDYGANTAGSLVRHTQTAYLATQNGYDYACDPTSTCGTSANIASVVHLRGLPTLVSVYDKDGIQRARTSFEYDNYAADTYHYPLSPEANISGLDSGFTASYLARGNVTATTRYLLDNAGTPTGSTTAYAQYDIAGNVVKAIDSRSTPTNIIATTFDFSDRFGAADGDAESNSSPVELSNASQLSYAFPTKITNAANHRVFAQTDYYVGRAVDAEDSNGIAQSVYSENDLLDRPTKAIGAANQFSAKAQGVTIYDDLNRTVTGKSDLSSFNDSAMKATTLYDGLGRTIETRTYEDTANYIAVRTQYDALGRAYKISNPFQTQNQGPANATLDWTVTEFDALGRVKTVTTPDSAVVTTSYSGNTVTVTDQALRKRRSVTDALGRVVRVDEPDAEHGNLDDGSGAPVQSTSYEYDALDNLTKVIQGSQTRTFVYDSLKRLVQATNPESGTVCYGHVVNAQCQKDGYDENGNLKFKTDARLVLTTYGYDALNRNISVTYSDGTPTVTRTYDNPTSGANGLGRLWKTETANTSLVTIDEYDALGRPKTVHQQFYVNGGWSQPFTVRADYDKAGHILTLTYPSNHSVSYYYDSAGRLADKDAQHLAFTGNLGDGSLRTYATAISYSTFGREEEKFGTDTPLYHKQRYTVRGQLWDMRVSTVPFANNPANGDRGAIVNYYSNNFAQGGSGPDNNGNLLRQENYIPGSDFFQDNFGYDSLNRLTSIGEKLNGTGNNIFTQSYGYDRFGNRTISGVSGAGINNLQTWIDPNSNRLYALGDQNVNDPEQRLIRYDAAGNQKADYYSPNWQGTRTYDAENRMKSAVDTSSNTSTYVYDGDGKRIKRIVNGLETWQVSGLGGELLAEYAANTAAANPKKEYGYRNGELLVTAEPPRTNVALASNGGLASGDSSYPGCAPSGANNGDRKGLNYFQNGSWAGATNTFPHWLQIDFNGSKTIDEIDVFTLQNNYNNPSETTDSMTFTLYGLSGYEVQYWNLDTSAWVTVTGGSVTGNNKIWRKFNFAAVTTDKVRVLTTASPSNWSEITEVEAWSIGTGSGVATINWLVTDQLGTPRMVFDQTGSLSGVSRHDFLPFGEDLPANFRSGTPGYVTADNVRQKFTSKERDNETGLDYFLARYYSSISGRFISPDPALVSASVENPQTWNRYTYVLNNPLLYCDPLGLWEVDPNYQVTTKTDNKGKKKVTDVTVMLKREKGDDVHTLATQLNISEKAAQKILDTMDSNGNIRLSGVGGNIGSVFSEIESQLKGFEQFKINHPDKGNDNRWDCSATASLLAFGVRLDGTPTVDNYLAAQTTDQNGLPTGERANARSVKQDKLSTGDAVRFAAGSNDRASHFATFLMFNRSGEPMVFSKSGIKGPYEFGRAADIGNRWGYGSITPVPGTGDKTGFYRSN